MTAGDPLAEFFTSSPRGSAGLAGRDGVHGRVDEILNDLEIPASLDGDGDWRIETDVGPFLIVVDKTGGDLLAIQTIRSMEEPVATHADDMYALLQLNVEAGSARFAALKDGDTDLLVLAARVRAGDVSRESVATMLLDSLRMSRTLDELVGSVQ